MFCFLNHIFVCSVDDLQLLNLNNFNCIINCSTNLNNFMYNPNYINLNCDVFNMNSYKLFCDIYFFIYDKIIKGLKIILLDTNGINNAMIIFMFFYMKYYNLCFSDVFIKIKSHIKLNDVCFYSGLIMFESQLFNKFYIL